MKVRMILTLTGTNSGAEELFAMRDGIVPSHYVGMLLDGNIPTTMGLPYPMMRSTSSKLDKADIEDDDITVYYSPTYGGLVVTQNVVYVKDPLTGRQAISAHRALAIVQANGWKPCRKNELIEIGK